MYKHEVLYSTPDGYGYGIVECPCKYPSLAYLTRCLNRLMGKGHEALNTIAYKSETEYQRNFAEYLQAVEEGTSFGVVSRPTIA